MKTPAQPLSILARALCLAVLLFSQYALAIHAVEHPFHDPGQGCEAFHGVPNLDQALKSGGEQSTPSLRDCSQARFFVPFEPVAAARAFPIRAPPTPSLK